ncbi:hypothetical protein KA977_04590, partial [Candidatus Dependentiae bacterium]|nr:hypothetical protein [Candidatus Dependentiae bacterium]
IFYFNSKNELNKNSGNLLNIPFNEKLYSVFSYNEEVNDNVKSLNKNEYAGLIDNNVLKFDLPGLIFQLNNINHQYKIESPVLYNFLDFVCKKIIKLNSDDSEKFLKEPIAMFTHDVDQVNINSVQHTLKFFESAIKNKDLKSFIYGISQLKKRVTSSKDINEINYENYLETENRFNCRSAFYFTCLGSERDNIDPLYTLKTKLIYNNITVKELWDRILKNGNEIGLHTSVYSIKRDKELNNEIKRIKNEVPELKGTRAHTLRVSENFYKILEQEKIEYDTSYSYNEMIGYRSGHFLPFYPFIDGRKLDVLIIPFSFMDSILAHQNGYPKNQTEKNMHFENIKVHMDNLIKHNGIMVFNWHFRTVNNSRMPYMFEIYKDILKYLYDKKIKFVRPCDFAYSYKKYLLNFYK